MRFPDPTLLVLMNYDNVPTIVEMMLEGSLVVPVNAWGDVPPQQYGLCIVAMSAAALTEDEHERLHAWIDADIIGRLPEGKNPVFI